MKYTFDDPTTPSFADIEARVPADATLSADRRRTLVARLRQLVRWRGEGALPGPSASDMPFSEAYIEGLAKRLAPATCGRVRSHALKPSGVAKKTVDNAISDCRFLLRHYGLSKRQSWIPLTPAYETLKGLIDCRYERIQIKRLLCFLSASGIAPQDVSPDVVPYFIAAVERDPRDGDPHSACRSALRVWKRLSARHRDVWPQVHLEMPRRRLVWGKPWKFFPPSLERAINDFLAPAQVSGRLFKARIRPGLRPLTIRTQKEALRCAASVLFLDGVPLQELSGLRALCAPARYERAIGLLEARAGNVTHWVEKAARVLLKIAKYGDVLEKAETEAVVKSHKEQVVVYYSEWKEKQTDRDQALLDKLDDPRVMDALLQLPTRTVRQVMAGGRKSPGAAYSIQRALLLELWLCAPLRNINILGLSTDHVVRVTINGIERVAIRVPANEVKNVEALEHFLNDDTARLLDLYVREYLPLIVTTPSRWLFPGPSGEPKTQQTLRVQMTNYISKNLKLEGFHPHVIRKIVPKIILDQDPGALEVVRRTGGWKTDMTLRRAYLQRRHRASQEKYLEMLESRRLQAFRPMTARKKGG